MAEYQPDEIARLEKLYSSNPGGRVFTHLAEAYRRTGELGRARQILEEGLRRHEGYASAHVVLGRVLSGLGESDAAAREFRRVLDLDAENLIALQALAEHAQRRGQTAEAIEYLRRLAQLDPGDEDVRELISRLEREAAAFEQGSTGFHDPFAPRPPSYDEPQPIPLADAPAFQTLDHLFGPDLGMPAGAYGTNEDPFAALDGDWTRGQPAAPESGADAGGDAEPAAAQSGGRDGGTERLDEGWPPLDASEAPALRFDWGIPPSDAPAPPAEPRAEAGPEPEPEPEGQPAAAWLSSINADWDTPAGLGFPVAASEPAASPAGPDAATGDAAADSNAERGAAGAGVAGGDAPDAADPHATIAGDEHLPHAAETEVYTETLAELYRAQGFPERAVAVYRSLLADRPGDQRLMQKLREMEGVADETAAAPGDERAAAQWAQVADDMERAAHDDATHHDLAQQHDDAPHHDAPHRDAPPDEQDDEAGERWLERVESAWTGGGGATGAGHAESPYSWSAEQQEPERVGAGPTIGALLGGLLAWRPTRGASGEPEEEILLLDEVAAEDEDRPLLEAAPARDAGTPPPAQGGEQVAADAGAATGIDAAGEADEPHAAAHTEAPEPPTVDAGLGDGMPGLDRHEVEVAAGQQDTADEGATDLRMPWELDGVEDSRSESADARAERGGQTGATDARAEGGREIGGEEQRADTPGTAAEPYLPMPWEVEEPAEADPWDPEHAQAWPPLEPVSRSEERGRGPGSGAAPPVAPSADAQSNAGDDDLNLGGGSADEDDDLEMFRSWLQSLKK